MRTNQRRAAPPHALTPDWDGSDTLVVLLIAAAAAGHWISDLPLGSFLLSGLWALLYVAAVTQLVQRFGWEWLRWTLARQPALSILLTLALASCLWSLDPALSIRRAGSLLATTIVGLFIGYSFPPPRLMRALYWMFVILIVSSIGVGLLLPTPVGDGVPLGWRGVMTHKNSLGAAALLAILYFLIITLHRQIRPLPGALLCAASLVALVQSRSRTSFVVLALSLVILAYLAAASATPRATRAKLWRLSLGLIISVSVVPFFIGPLASMLGNDDPLNGRTAIWDGALTIFRERPLTGYGYGVVWGRSGATLLPHIPITAHRSATSAHNSIANVATELGVPAAIVACTYLLAALGNARRLFARQPTAFSAFALLFVVAVTLVGAAEALLLRVHSFWILFVAVTVAVQRSLQTPDERLSEGYGSNQGRDPRWTIDPAPPAARESHRAEAAPQARPLSYALVTPARNEAEFIGRTLRSVVRQTTPPLRWVVVSDGSTDGTDRIVQEYARRYAWIELVRLAEGEGRTFARKAHAFNAGYQRLRGVPYDIVGNLDADVSFDEEYFGFLLDRFAATPDLGVAGTPFLEGVTRYDYRFTNIHHVSGGCQLFRRACFEDVGGYLPVKVGGIDWIAVTTARMRGWQTRTFVEKALVHHRQMGSAGRRGWEPWFRRGEMDYALGGHPLWQLLRCVYQSKSRPYMIGGLLLLCGYVYGSVQGTKRPVSDELMRFHRQEQMSRLKRMALHLLYAQTRRARARESGEVSLHERLARLETWVERHDYKAYEPFDGLASPLRVLTFGNQSLERILQQVGRQSPLNLRPLLGIKPLESSKGRGYMARGYLAGLQRTGSAAYERKAIACLEWLMQNTSPLYPDASWGNHFDYASRAGRYAKHESTIVWTSLIGQAFLDAYEILGDARHLDVARSVCAWILKLPRERSATGTCLSYLASRQLSIHNANLLGAAMLARTAKHTGTAELLDVARPALEYSCSRQLAGGAWHYGAGPTYHWIDNFHTAYNLDAIKCYRDCTGDQTFDRQLDAGFRYFTTHFVEADGRPRYYSDRAYPIDIQCAAQTIETLANFSERDPAALRTALQVARWTVRSMQDASGYFYYRRYPFFVARIPMLHWGQATMYRALALLLLKLAREAVRVPTQPAHAGGGVQRHPAA